MSTLLPSEAKPPQPKGIMDYERIAAADVRVGDRIARARTHDFHTVTAVPKCAGGFISLEGSGRIRPRGTAPIWREVPAERVAPDWYEDPDNIRRAEHGQRGIETAPDFESNDLATSAGDAIANILHAAVRDAWSENALPDDSELEVGEYASDILDRAFFHFDAELRGTI